jgi:hypothetical protein|tara:strand:- start:539 stop:1192 length:654 start_codon:yes stop_codon:yes gene_type:complete
MGIGPASIIGGGLSIVSGLFGASAARKREREARKERKRLQGKLNTLEANRQEIVNPYQDLSSMVSNPFANLSVATGAAEMQIEEADISLANTLDTLRATGASAGGATALAQAALRSKKGVAASIEAQEKSNEDKRAAGEKQKQTQLMAEAQRVQEGEAYEFGLREKREIGELDRTAALLGASKQAEAQAQMDQTGALTGALGTLGGIAATPGLFGNN